MEICYKEAILKVHKNGLVEKLNKRTGKWFVPPIHKDKQGDAATRVDYKYVKIYKLISTYFGLKIDDNLCDIYHLNRNKFDNSLNNLVVVKKTLTAQ